MGQPSFPWYTQRDIVSRPFHSCYCEEEPGGEGAIPKGAQHTCTFAYKYTHRMPGKYMKHLEIISHLN